jgi:hypothetical protein
MTKLENFNELGFSITWKLINLGFKGSNFFKNELSSKDIIDFAVSIMAREQDLDADIVDLACECDVNVDEVDKYVKKLAEKENTEHDLDYRKWQVLYVLRHLPKPEAEFIGGLIELGDIWSQFDFPSYSPHIFQGRNNSITPEQYYTQENYNNLLHKHAEWIDGEINQIKFLQGVPLPLPFTQ